MYRVDKERCINGTSPSESGERNWEGEWWVSRSVHCIQNAPQFENYEFERSCNNSIFLVPTITQISQNSRFTAAHCFLGAQYSVCLNYAPLNLVLSFSAGTSLTQFSKNLCSSYFVLIL